MWDAGRVKALVKCKPGPGLELIEIPVPVVGPGDVLVEVKATGICGTDLHIEAWDRLGGEEDRDAEDGGARVRR